MERACAAGGWCGSYCRESRARMSVPGFEHRQAVTVYKDGGFKGAVIDEVVVRWRPWVATGESDDEDELGRPRWSVGLERAVLLRLAVGPPTECRHRVSVAAWTVGMRLDTSDLTEVGMLLDEGNECLLVPGEKVAIKIRSVRARCCSDAKCRNRTDVSLVIFAELDPMGTFVRYVFLPGEDVARMTVTEVSSRTTSVGKSNAAKAGYVPEAPPPRAKKQPTMEEACAAAAATRAAKRAKKGAEGSAAEGADEGMDEGSD